MVIVGGGAAHAFVDHHRQAGALLAGWLDDLGVTVRLRAPVEEVRHEHDEDLDRGTELVRAVAPFLP